MVVEWLANIGSGESKAEVAVTSISCTSPTASYLRESVVNVLCVMLITPNHTDITSEGSKKAAAKIISTDDSNDE